VRSGKNNIAVPLFGFALRTPHFALRTILAAASILAVPSFANAQTDIRFRNDYNETRKEADQRGLPVVIYCTTDNCSWCLRLQRETFADPTVAKVMNERFVPLKVHAMQEPRLVEMLRIRAFPTIILAAPDGKILMTVEGYQEASVFHENLQRVLAAVSNPDWMQRDYQIAAKAINDRDYAKGVALLKAILEDGKSRPVQINASNLLKQVEQQASVELGQARRMVETGRTSEASTVLARLVKDYAGTQAAPEAAGMLTNLAKTTELRGPQRTTRARELLAQAKDEYRAEQWLHCLDRCDLLIQSYGDLPEGGEALQMAAAIRSNPDWMQKACDSMSGRLGEMYLGLAESWLQKGQPQQATLCLERVIRTFPGTRHAEAAQFRLAQLKGLPTQRSAFPPDDRK
jgi:thioredoxin-like negative regulator of GroEL